MPEPLLIPSLRFLLLRVGLHVAMFSFQTLYVHAKKPSLPTRRADDALKWTRCLLGVMSNMPIWEYHSSFISISVSIAPQNKLVFLALCFCSRLRRGQPVCDRIAADCLATAASRCAVASCVLRRQMFRSLKQCVKQSCPPQEEQQGDMLLFINSNAFSPHRRGRAALFLSLREEVELNSLRYM